MVSARKVVLHTVGAELESLTMLRRKQVQVMVNRYFSENLFLTRETLVEEVMTLLEQVLRESQEEISLLRKIVVDAERGDH